MLRAARPTRLPFLSSLVRIIAVMTVVFGVLALETSNAMATGTATTTFAGASLAPSSAPPLQKPHAARLTGAVLTAAAPYRSIARARIATSTAHAVAKPAAHRRSSTEAARAGTKTVTANLPPRGYGCSAALSYLSGHAAPGFHFECPGDAEGHQAMTCVNVAGICPGSRLIVINVPCAAAYMNEASNSWVLTGLRSAPIDPYGYCT